MKVSNIQTIIWDLDGTILESFELFQEILSDALKDFDLVAPSRQTMLLNFHGSLEETIANVLHIEGDQLLEVVEAFLRVQHTHYAEIEHLIHPDAVALAKQARGKGIQQIIVTNREHESRGDASPRSIISRSSLRDTFEHIVAGDDVVYRKPDARAVEHVQLAGNILVIGDQFVDAEFARNMRGQAILVNRHTEDIAHLEKLGLDWRSYVTIVNSLEEVELS